MSFTDHAECQREMNRLRRERQDVLDALARIKTELSFVLERIREEYPRPERT